MTETAPSASGLLKQLRICPEATYGTAAAASSGSAQQLRRVSSTIELAKNTFKSNEIQPDRQIHDFRHGLRLVKGSLRGELSPLTYQTIWQQMLAGTWTAGVSNTAVDIAGVAAVANTSPGYFLRASGSWITDGFKVGDIVQATGFASGGVANNGRNYRVTGITETSTANDTLQVGPTPTTANPSVGNEAVAAIASASGVTITVQGYKLITPAAGSLVDQSFTLEHWYQDIAIDEYFTGCRASGASLTLPPSGISTVDFDIMGQNMTTGSAQYFTAASAVTTDTSVAALNGLIRINGADYFIITGARMNIKLGYTTEAVVGSTVTPYLYPGIQDITGTVTGLFADESLDTLFINETDNIQILLALYLTNAINAPFISFNMPRCKLTSGGKDDKPGAISATYGFQAINNVAGGAATSTDATTLAIQDSLVT